MTSSGNLLAGQLTDAERAIAAARQAFGKWSLSNPQERFDILDRAGTEILARKEELGKQLAREMGKPLADAMGEAGRAGAIFHAGIASGKFHGVIAADDAERLAGDLDFDARPRRVDLLAAEPHRFAGEELEDRAGAAGLADAVGERLALLAREQSSELLLAREDLGAGAIEDVEPFLRCRARPLRECRPRGGDGLIDFDAVAARELADDVARDSRD